jgi:hypothetical protein
LGLDSVPEIEKAFHSLEGKFSFLEDLDMEDRSVPKIKESVFISPSPKDVQVIKSEKKIIPFTFTPGRYEILVLNLLTSGSSVLECTFKGGSKKVQIKSPIERNETSELKQNQSWEFVLKISPDEVFLFF